MRSSKPHVPWQRNLLKILPDDCAKLEVYRDAHLVVGVVEAILISSD